MLNKLSGKVLIIAAVLLLSIFLFSTYFGPSASKRTFPDQLLMLDSANVVAITISPKAEGHTPFRLVKGEAWRIERDGNGFATEPGRAERVLQEFKLLKPKRMAGKSEESWQKYEVNDSLGTRVVFEMADGSTHEIMVGKFTFDQARRSGTSFVRVNGEKETYAVEGFLSMAVNQPMNNWRNKLLLEGTKDSWSELRFSYPADSGFVLTRSGTQWQINGQAADSARVTDFLTTLNTVQSVHFVDGVQVPGSPIYSLTLAPVGVGQMVTIEAFDVGGEHGLLVRSSLNPDSYFSNAQSQLVEKLFTRALYFYPSSEE